MNRRTFIQALALIPAALGIKAAAQPKPIEVPPDDWVLTDPIRGLFPGQDRERMAYLDLRMHQLAQSFGRSMRDKADAVVWVNEYDRACNPCKEFGYFLRRDTGKQTRYFALPDLKYQHKFVEAYETIVKELF